MTQDDAEDNDDQDDVHIHHSANFLASLCSFCSNALLLTTKHVDLNVVQQRRRRRRRKEDFLLIIFYLSDQGGINTAEVYGGYRDKRILLPPTFPLLP